MPGDSNIKSKEKSLRLFLGLAAPLDYALQPLREHLQQQSPGSRENKKSGEILRFVRKTDLHITLKYLGSVTEAELPSLVTTAANRFADFGPLVLSAQGVGMFRNAVWVGVAKNERLIQMAAELNGAFLDHGIAPESRLYQPHVTVARFHKGVNIDQEQLATKFGEQQWGEFTAAKAFLYHSDTLPEGARYTIMKSFALTGG